jgi:hypothetical protein
LSCGDEATRVFERLTCGCQAAVVRDRDFLPGPFWHRWVARFLAHCKHCLLQPYSEGIASWVVEQERDLVQPVLCYRGVQDRC